MLISRPARGASKHANAPAAHLRRIQGVWLAPLSKWPNSSTGGQQTDRGSQSRERAIRNIVVVVVSAMLSLRSLPQQAS